MRVSLVTLAMILHSAVSFAQRVGPSEFGYTSNEDAGYGWTIFIILALLFIFTPKGGWKFGKKDEAD